MLLINLTKNKNLLYKIARIRILYNDSNLEKTKFKN